MSYVIWIIQLENAARHFNWLHPRSISVGPDIYRGKACDFFQMKNLEISDEKDGIFKALAKTMTNYIAKNKWRPVFQKIYNSYKYYNLNLV